MAKLAPSDYDGIGAVVGIDIDNFLVDSVDDSADLMTFYSCLSCVCMYVCVCLCVYVCVCLCLYL